MREDCKFFQLRTYPSGDVASFCALGLAPEAPWRCPQGCRRFEKRVQDKTAAPAAPSPPPETDLGSGAAALLGVADDVIRAAGPEIVAEQERRRRREQERRPWWKRLRRQAPWRRTY